MKIEHPPETREDTDRSEAELLRRVVERDQAALEEIYILYYPKLTRFLSKVLGVSNQQALPGLINEVMYVVWKKADSFNHTSKVSSWIFGISLRIAKKYQSVQSGYEKNQRQLLLESELPPIEHWESKLESSDLLRKALTQLSQEQKAVIELTYFNGLHYSEIAEILDCPENTVKSRMFYARLRLRSLLRGTDMAEAADQGHKG